MGKGIFITGTGTDLGKTFCTALVVKKLKDAGYKSGYYKAALSGAEIVNGELIPGDADYVKKIAGLDLSYEDMVSYIYENAVSPHLAAQIEGNPVEMDKVKSDYARSLDKHDFVTVEGSGGIVCPIRMDETEIMLEDIIKALELPVIIVSNAKLGSINALVLTSEYCKSRGIEVKGIILNQYDGDDKMQSDNKFMMEKLSGVKVIATVSDGDSELDIDADLLASLYR